MTHHLVRPGTRPVAALLAVLALAGCTSAGRADLTAAEAVTVADAWVKAADEGMSAAFGTLTNTSDGDVTLVSATSPAATTVELHETVMSGGTMVMREAEGGFVVPAGGTFVLEPGANHIMLLGLTGPVPAGSEVEVALTAEDGTEVTVVVAARTFAGAEETYAPGEETETSSMTPTATPSS